MLLVLLGVPSLLYIAISDGLKNNTKKIKNLSEKY
nr:MAG TPA: hypothetical protein [Caudoviricetes sp.]